MKKVVLVQVILLLCTVLLGLSLKTGILPVSSDLHRYFGLSAGLLGMLVAIMAFIYKQKSLIKILAMIAVLLIFSAAIGGSSLESAANYDISYVQMVVSGFLALVVSIVIYFKLSKKPRN